MDVPRHTLVVSDVHLRGITPGTPRRLETMPDAALAELIDAALAASHSACLEVVCNGDVLDFDVPDARTAGDGVPPPSVSHGEAGAADLAGAILRDHPTWVAALARVLRAGHGVVFVAGNHDAHLAFPAVRAVVAQHLHRAAGVTHGVVFRTLFHRTPDGWHLEHGHQYDPLCALDAPGVVSGPDGRLYLENTVGSLLSYVIPALLACVEPWAHDPVVALGEHPLRAASRCVGASPVPGVELGAAGAGLARALALVRSRRTEEALAELSFVVGDETGLDPCVVMRQTALFAPKASADGLASPDAWAGYGRATDRRLRAAAGAIGSLYGARGVVMGHTHAPWEAWTSGRFFGNTGAWHPGPDGRTRGAYAWLTTGPAGAAAHVRRWGPP